MERKTRKPDTPGPGIGRGGFTLLEVIVAVVVAGIMAVFLAQFVYTGVIHSADPVRQLQAMYGWGSGVPGVTGIMETMTASYKNLASTQSDFLAIFKDYVDNGNKTTGRPTGYPYFGPYETIRNDYIVFDGTGKEQPAGPTERTILRVTIRSGNQTATALFTR